MLMDLWKVNETRTHARDVMRMVRNRILRESKMQKQKMEREKRTEFRTTHADRADGGIEKNPITTQHVKRAMDANRRKI